MLAISIVVKLSDEIIDAISNQPTFMYFHHYRTVNAFIDQVGLQISMLLEKHGYSAMPIAASQSIPDAKMPYSGAFSHKTAACAAGLGSIGKSALFLSHQHGPRVRLGTILTNAPLQTNHAEYKDVCKDCTLCTNACPAMAITGKSYTLDSRREDLFDAAACSSYMKNNFQHIGRGVVCGICVKVCPLSKK